ncbi:hypothetical protein EYF80_024684 [Liparis tanakae]|uniref:Uncharacterized protein n=1 Tax=Liparis tanakae TaxID=230148 RepID=A0A4Z2HIH1_9TELE|nr:hypothetical protein EYF80_024684 [Liparis tanakae]
MNRKKGLQQKAVASAGRTPAGKSEEKKERMTGPSFCEVGHNKVENTREEEMAGRGALNEQELIRPDIWRARRLECACDALASISADLHEKFPHRPRSEWRWHVSPAKLEHRSFRKQNKEPSSISVPGVSGQARVDVSPSRGGPVRSTSRPTPRPPETNPPGDRDFLENRTQEDGWKKGLKESR